MRIIIFLIAVSLLSCSGKTDRQSDTTDVEVKKHTVDSLMRDSKLIINITEKDEEDITQLIRNVLIWSESKRNYDLLSPMPDKNDSLYIGIDFEQHKTNLESLSSTNYFSVDFLENFNRIIITLDKGIKDKNYGDWYVNDMPPFIFLSGVNPWCSCQDHLGFESVFVEIINAEKGELLWKYGDVKPDYNPGWSEFEYRFNVVRENNSWKISYLQGFDYDENTK